MNIRDQLYCKARKSKKQLDWVSYKPKRNFVKNEIQRTEKNFISKELRGTSNKPDKFQNTVKKLYPTKSKSLKFTTTFRTIDKKLLTEKQSIADGFCQFFSSATNHLKRTTFPLTEITCRAKPTKVSLIRQQFSFKTVSDEELLKHLKKLYRKSAMGLDEIPPLFLKDTGYIISKLLARIMNCSLLSGVVPNDFKRARVIPVYKSSAHDNFDNYQPISVLPAISKILEKCVHSQLIEHLEKNNLLSQNQFGFRKYRSTELAAVWFTDQIRRSMDAGMLAGAIYADMSKAFDTVRQAGIMNKLPDYGITGLPQE